MIIKLIFDQSSGPGFAAFKTGVETAALMLEKAITNPITVTIEVGYGLFPTDHTRLPVGRRRRAQSRPRLDFFVFGCFGGPDCQAAAIGDTNFNALTSAGGHVDHGI